MAGRPANTGRFHALLSRAASSSSDSSSEGSSSLDLPTSAGKPAFSGAGPSKAAAPSAPMGAPASGNGPSRQAQGLLPATPIVGNDRGASIPASTTEAFIEAMQALSLRPDEKLHPAHQVRAIFPSLPPCNLLLNQRLPSPSPLRSASATTSMTASPTASVCCGRPPWQRCRFVYLGFYLPSVFFFRLSFPWSSASPWALTFMIV